MAGRVSQSVNDRIRPKAAAVLAYAPRFILHAPFRRSFSEQLRGTVASDVLRGIENGDRTSDDFISAVPHDQASPIIPGHHRAVRTYHEDGVVPQARDQQTAKLFALTW